MLKIIKNKALYAFSIFATAIVASLVIVTLAHSKTIQDEVRALPAEVVVFEYSRCETERMFIVGGLVGHGMAASLGLSRGWNWYFFDGDQEQEAIQLANLFPGNVNKIDKVLPCVAESELPIGESGLPIKKIPFVVTQ